MCTVAIRCHAIDSSRIQYENDNLRVKHNLLMYQSVKHNVYIPSQSFAKFSVTHAEVLTQRE